AAHPDDPYVCSKLGALYVQMGDVAGGMALLQRGLAALTPESTVDRPFTPEASPFPNFQVCYELHYHLGRAYSRLQQFPLAEQHYRTALQQPILDRLKLGAQNNLGSLLQTKGDLAGAKAAYQACLAIDPDFAIGYYNLGMVLKGLGQLGDAVMCYQRAIALKPDYAEAHQNLGVVLLKLGRIPDSLQAFQKAINLYQQQNPAAATQLQQKLQELGFQR
ncbi:MAG TPA: tetratricopeptide repeat protein, partial [Allocoleopsis sp.]